MKINNCGREVTVDKPPQQAVSLNQASTEILLSLGLADRMVGTATWTDPVKPNLEDENRKVERLADNAPSLERVLEKEPDIVTASLNNTLGDGGVTTPQRLEKLGVPSYVSPSECSKRDAKSVDGARKSRLEIDTIYQEINELAKIFGTPAKGTELVESLRARMRKAADTAPKNDTSVLFWFANSESPYMAGCCGAPGIISRTLGLKNVFEDSTEEWPQISWETVAARNPDVMIIGDLTRRSETAETATEKIKFLKSNPVTREMEAVKNDRFIALAGGAMNPSIRTADGTELIAARLQKLDPTR
ncbi:ABC transporter substrate-binding protein [Gordonia hydrophobica]|uniref:ABC transporter substrate-binding protein n=1 Tax=Gordonia hydrophobica TaxID=40516 RepID=A0ABZ2U5C1_9ACTN|nr:ABC transporter substrate-binding protein [Gordonia hydrophobica]MBM7369488.1 iron complex transport system substrate-binding protein [Gordonia hydrophobica]